MPDDDDDDESGAPKWQSVEIDTRPVDIADVPESTTGLEEEPIVKYGLAAALLLAQKKGFYFSFGLSVAHSSHSKLVGELVVISTCMS